MVAVNSVSVFELKSFRNFTLEGVTSTCSFVNLYLLLVLSLGSL